jgi:hypothetical protein
MCRHDITREDTNKKGSPLARRRPVDIPWQNAHRPARASLRFAYFKPAM